MVVGVGDRVWKYLVERYHHHRYEDVSLLGMGRSNSDLVVQNGGIVVVTRVRLYVHVVVRGFRVRFVSLDADSGSRVEVSSSDGDSFSFVMEFDFDSTKGGGSRVDWLVDVPSSLDGDFWPFVIEFDFDSTNDDINLGRYSR